MSKQDWEKNTLVNIFGDDFPKDVESVLDVACGLSLKSKFIPAKIRVGVDIYSEYFKHIEADVPYIVMKHDVRSLDQIFMPKSFDVVIALDILEHLTKLEALSMMRQCESIARKAVIFETPVGFVPQDIDILGHGGDEWQTHRSGWEAAEFEEMGYKTITREYTMVDVKRHSTLVVDPHINLIDAIKLL